MVYFIFRNFERRYYKTGSEDIEIFFSTFAARTPSCLLATYCILSYLPNCRQGDGRDMTYAHLHAY